MRKLIATLALLTTATLTAQTKLTPPPLGPIVSYQYWPTQYIQFVTGPELSYSMFMFEADTTGKQPLYHAALTGKDGRATHYSNADALVAYYKAQGAPSYKANFAVESDETEKVGATTTVRFTAFDEKPVEFRFVQGSDISEQGSGLQPLPTAPIPVFAYRELGAVAGEGTALKVGNAVSAAEVWTEISKPPYFVGYRGAITQSAHLVVLPKLTETWTVTKYPDTLAPNSTWEMDNDRGNHLTLKLEKVAGTSYTFSATDRQHPNNRMSLETSRTPVNGTDTWTTTRVTYMPAIKGGEKHAATFTYTPGLSTGTPATGGSSTSTTTTASTTASTSATTTGTLDLAFAKKQKVVTATLTESGDATDRTTDLKFTAPAWTTTKSLTTETKLNNDTATITAK